MRGRRWTGRLAGLGLLVLLAGGCLRTQPEPTPPVQTEAPVSPPAHVRTPAPEDPSQGFEPPTALTAPAPALVVTEDELREPESVPVAERMPLLEPWPAPVPMEPPGPQPPTPDGSQPCRQERYLAHDPRPLETVELEYDGQGRVIRERVDEDTDGTIDVDHHWRWGADGRLLGHDAHVGPVPTCDGPEPAHVARTVHRYDRHGVWRGGPTRTKGWVDAEPNWIHTAYDEAGRPTRWIEHPHGQVNRALALRWHEGRLVEQVEYAGMEARQIERWHFEPRERYHARWQGQDWSVTREQLDAQGRVVLVQHDEDGDGTVDTVERRTHDSEGREVSRRLDADGDGTFETHTEVRWDDAGRRVEEVTAGPTGEARQIWRYDEAGRLLEWRHTRPDTWAEDFETHRYDPQGRELERTSERYQAVRSASDLSHYVAREHWEGEYDEAGRLVRERVLQGRLGPDERIEHIYDCRRPYRRFPRRNPLDHPETAAECFETFE